MDIVLGIISIIVILIVGFALIGLLDDDINGCGGGCGCLILIVLLAAASCFSIIWFL